MTPAEVQVETRERGAILFLLGRAAATASGDAADIALKMKDDLAEVYAACPVAAYAKPIEMKASPKADAGFSGDSKENLQTGSATASKIPPSAGKT